MFQALLVEVSAGVLDEHRQQIGERDIGRYA